MPHSLGHFLYGQWHLLQFLCFLVWPFFFFLMGIISRWKEPLLVHSGLPKELIVAPPLVWCGNLLVPYLPPETLQRRKAFNSFIPSSPSLSLHRLSLGGVCVCVLLKALLTSKPA